MVYQKLHVIYFSIKFKPYSLSICICLCISLLIITEIVWLFFWFRNYLNSAFIFSVYVLNHIYIYTTTYLTFQRYRHYTHLSVYPCIILFWIYSPLKFFRNNPILLTQLTMLFYQIYIYTYISYSTVFHIGFTELYIQLNWNT